MAKAFASNKRAIAECDICGFQYKLKDLRSLVVRGRDTNLLACVAECWNEEATGAVGDVTVTTG